MDAFDLFVACHQGALKRIARATRGEQQYADVVQEAWLMANDMASRNGVTIADFLDRASPKVLLSHLYQKLVRYTELNVRHAVRLDHAINPDDGEEAANPLMHRLAGDDGSDPLSYLRAIEDAPDLALYSRYQHSLAGAYLALLNRLGNHMRVVARHLLVSLSHAYRCHARARWFATHQWPLRLPMDEADFRLGPWRRARTGAASLRVRGRAAVRSPMNGLGGVRADPSVPDAQSVEGFNCHRPTTVGSPRWWRQGRR